MALAHTLIDAGHVSAVDWAETLGATLRKAEARGEPDTQTTYYACVLSALETVTQPHVSVEARQKRRAEWEEAYMRTPHGAPVTLD